jgi:hypothetical protein
VTDEIEALAKSDERPVHPILGPREMSDLESAKWVKADI